MMTSVEWISSIENSWMKTTRAVQVMHSDLMLKNVYGELSDYYICKSQKFNTILASII